MIIGKRVDNGVKPPNSKQFWFCMVKGCKWEGSATMEVLVAHLCEHHNYEMLRLLYREGLIFGR